MIEYQIHNASAHGYSSADEQSFAFSAFFGPLIGGILTGLCGAVLGAAFAIAAHLRHEPAFPIRTIAFIINVGLASYGIYLLTPFLTA